MYIESSVFALIAHTPLMVYGAHMTRYWINSYIMTMTYRMSNFHEGFRSVCHITRLHHANYRPQNNREQLRVKDHSYK